MAACMGLLNDDATPPFPAISHNEDGVFGVLLAARDPSALFAHVPVGVFHDYIVQPGGRATDPRRRNADSRSCWSRSCSDIFPSVTARRRPIGCARSVAC